MLRIDLKERWADKGNHQRKSEIVFGWRKT